MSLCAGVAQEVSAAQLLSEPCYCLNGGECVSISDNTDNPSKVRCKCQHGWYHTPVVCIAPCVYLYCMSYCHFWSVCWIFCVRQFASYFFLFTIIHFSLVPRL